MLNYETLKGKILVSIPSQKENFVILIYRHDQNGTYGLNLNHILPQDFLYKLMDRLKITYYDTNLNIKINYGGSENLQNGLILHSTDYILPASLQLTENLAITNSISMLKKIALHEGPKNNTVILGHTFWPPNDLESEIRHNKWLITDANPDLVFHPNEDQIWNLAMSLIGLEPSSLPHQFYFYTGTT